MHPEIHASASIVQNKQQLNCLVYLPSHQGTQDNDHELHMFASLASVEAAITCLVTRTTTPSVTALRKSDSSTSPSFSGLKQWPSCITPQRYSHHVTAPYGDFHRSIPNASLITTIKHRGNRLACPFAPQFRPQPRPCVWLLQAQLQSKRRFAAPPLASLLT